MTSFFKVPGWIQRVDRQRRIDILKRLLGMAHDGALLCGLTQYCRVMRRKLEGELQLASGRRPIPFVFKIPSPSTA